VEENNAALYFKDTFRRRFWMKFVI